MYQRRNKQSPKKIGFLIGFRVDFNSSPITHTHKHTLTYTNTKKYYAHQKGNGHQKVYHRNKTKES